MKTQLRILLRMGIFLSAIFFYSISTKALPYTCVNSGNWSNPATWGGIAPPFNLTADQILIPAGKTVTLDNDCTCNGLLATLTVLGTLDCLAGKTLTLTQCSLIGTGNINVDNIICNTGAVLLFTGNATAKKLECAALNLGLSASMLATEQLACTQGLLSVLAGGHISLGNSADIVIAGGALSLGGTSLGTNGIYNVIYNGSSCTCGDELSGVGLHNITVDVNTGNTVSLAKNLIVDGTLHLVNGTLVCGNHDLTLNGDLLNSSVGSLACSPLTSITVNAVAGLTDALKLDNNNHTCKNFTVNCGPTGLVKIAGDLVVNTALNLTGGILSCHDNTLTLNGILSGPGSLSCNPGSIININTVGGLTAPLNFATGGQTVKDFNINCGPANSIILGTALIVEGALNLINGCKCKMSNQTLTLGTLASISGTGSLVTNSLSGMVCNCSNGLSSLHLADNILGNLVVNCGGAGVGLNDHLNVANLLTLTSGLLVLNNHDLTISGNIAVGGVGSISATIGSNLTVSCPSSPSGLLRLDVGSTLNSCTINLGSPGAVSLGSNLNVANVLNLTNGCINTGNFGVNLDLNAVINGASPTCYVITGDNGFLGINVEAEVSGIVTFPIGTTTGYAPIDINCHSGGAGEIDCKVVPDVHSNCDAGVDISLTQHVVDYTWNINSPNMSNPNMDVKPKWIAASEVNGFDHQSCYVAQYKSTTNSWDQVSPAPATNENNGYFSILRTGLDAFGCISIFDNTTITSTNEVDVPFFELYPSLVHDIMTMNTSEIVKNRTNVEIYNINGQLVKSDRLLSENKEISLLELNPGCYFVKITDSNITEIKKIIKQ